MELENYLNKFSEMLEPIDEDKTSWHLITGILDDLLEKKFPFKMTEENAEVIYHFAVKLKSHLIEEIKKDDMEFSRYMYLIKNRGRL